MVAPPEATRDGVMIFAKNSDREPNEAQYIEIIPETRHPSGRRLECTYIEIPQAEKTNRVMISRPFWMWGAEMGTNEHGLTIGNEAVFTREQYSKEPSLTGMDLLRLALERASDSSGAVDVITGLLDTYGQGGNCGYKHKMHYHNSFIICDPKEAWVLETAGRKWAAKRIRDIYAISNGLTIEKDWDRASVELEKESHSPGFSFSRDYSDFIYMRFSDCRRRRRRAIDLLSKEHVTVRRMMQILRDHHDRSISSGITGASICNHAGFGPVRGSQTTGSLVSHLQSERQTHFVTAGAAPCTGIFKPVWMDGEIPELGLPAGVQDDSTYFWRHEKLHRAVLEHGNLYAEERDRLEEEFVTKALSLIDAEARRDYCMKAFCLADSIEKTWTDRTKNEPKKNNPFLYKKAWKNFNKEACFENKD